MKNFLSFRFVLACFVLAIFTPYDQATAFFMAGIVLVFPSWKFVKGRLAIGEQETPELLEIKKLTQQIKDYEKQLGEKALKQDFTDVTKQLADMKLNIGKYSEKELDSRLLEVNNGIDKINKQLTEHAEDLAKAKDAGSKKPQGIQLYKEEDLKRVTESVFKDGKKTGERASFEINSKALFRNKAAEVMGYPQTFEGDGVTATIETMGVFTGRVIDPTLYQRKRKRNFILDNMPIETIDAPFLYYMEKVEVSGSNGSDEDPGGADWILPGAAKPMRSFRVQVQKADRKKLAIFTTVDDELLRDVPSFANWIDEDFRQEMREEYNTGLLDNDPGVDASAPLGLKTNAVQYTDIAGFIITNPTAIDAIIAAIAEMENNNEEPLFVAVSTLRYYQLLTIKDTQQRYQNNNLIYTNNIGQLYIAGVLIVKADTNDIPYTHFMVVGADAFRIKNIGNIVIERGLNDDDFRKDRTSFRGYQYVLSYIPSSRYNAVMYDAFATVISAVGS